MGLLLSFMSEKMFGPEKAKIAMLGLDAAGKTTILYKLKINENVTTIPTVGFNVEEINFHNLTMTVWDVGQGGQKIIRYYDTKYERFPCIVYCRVANSTMSRLVAPQSQYYFFQTDGTLLSFWLPQHILIFYISIQKALSITY